MTPDRIPIGQETLAATMLALGTLAGAVAGHSLRRRSIRARGPRPRDVATSKRLAVTQQTPDETTTRLHALDEQLDEARASLAEAQAEVQRLRGTAKATTDRAETEMGRMESAAITALESAAASNRQEVAGLRQRLAAAEDAARILQTELDAERMQSAQLRSALTDRDTQLANLRASTRDTHHRT